jgi:tRNA uridine 5-carboxymethylaminomethyl modification enzyme
MTNDFFDVVVIGGGHAGAEAARVAARGGARVALITMMAESIGRMSCNPAIGGLAKGHLVKELDALGGLMGEATDAAGIQFKVLNRSKGPAVQGPRAQTDRDVYAATVQQILAAEPLLTIIEGSVVALEGSDGRITGVKISPRHREGSVETIAARTVVVTTGTFLHALMHSGEEKTAGGRWGEPSAVGLSESLRSFGLRLGRLKTGTPPRVLRDSADFSLMEPQPGDERPRPFSILTDSIPLPQMLCWLTWTASEAHELIRANLHRAPMFTGQIEGTGPRYCPSIEDKVVRFADKERHQIFVEPEGIDHPWLYLNGISTSLPADVQDGVIHSIPGLENAVIARYGYAVEYDFVNPEQLHPTLECRAVAGLFLAGQINGTSGYEEAAAQGFLAGVNALLQIRGEEPLILRRDQAYLAVMVDDLVTHGTEEPYRMFTSRAEHRLLLGCDSVYERLTPIAERLGIIDAERLRRADQRISRMRAATALFAATELNPDRHTIAWLERHGIKLTQQTTFAKLLQRPDLDVVAFARAAAEEGELEAVVKSVEGLRDEELEGVVNQFRYSGYLDKQAREAERLRHFDELPIPVDFSYERPGLSRELVEKLSAVRPLSFGQASRIQGMTPSALSILRMHLLQGRRREMAGLER